MSRTWVVGAGGLIGRSIVHAADEPWEHTHIDWTDLGQASAQITYALSRFTRECGDDPWSIAWAAGSGTVGTTTDALKAETRLLEVFLDALAMRPPRGRGAFLLASSAGGVYAGSQEPPFTVDHAPRPISAYGEQKLLHEQLVTEMLGDACSTVIARFSNVYGPDQNLAKAQGLISQLALATVTRQPLNVYVPLQTVRDYVYAADAGAAAAYWLGEAITDSPEHSIRIIASGEGTSVASLIGIASDIVRRRIPIALGSNARSRIQAFDLRFVPSQPSNGYFPATPLPVGMRRVVDAVVRQQQVRPLAAVR